jgi:hypothetical protein
MPTFQSFSRRLFLLPVFGLWLTLLACSDSSPPPAEDIIVRVTPTEETLYGGEQVQFQATVTGTSDTRVRWEVTTGGGQVDDTGFYTAPYTPGSYQVIAISLADEQIQGRARITVLPEEELPAQLTLSVLPTQRQMKQGEAAFFEAQISNGTGNEQLEWRVEEGIAGGRVFPGNGNTATYTAPSTPGTYHVVASIQGRTQPVARATVIVSAQAPSATLRGTVRYSGQKTGRVYVLLTWGYGSGDSLVAQAGTSLERPGSYTLAPLTGTNLPVYLVAFMDTQNQGRPNLVTDPIARVRLPITGEDQTLDLLLEDPPASAEPPTSSVSSFRAGLADGMLVSVGAFTDALYLGAERADAYSLYWSQQPDPGPDSNLGSRVIPARHRLREYSVIVAVHGLAPGRYYASVAARNGSAEGPLSSSFVDVGSQPGTGATLSGQLTLEAASATGSAYVLVGSTNAPPRAVRVPTTTSPVSWSMPGLPEGQYTVWALLDADGDGIIERATPSLDARPQVAVSGTGTVSAPGLAFGPEPVRTKLTFLHQNTLLYPGGFQGGGIFYSFSTYGGTKQPVAVRLTQGQGLPIPFDVPINTRALFGSVSGFATPALQYSWNVPDLASALPGGSQLSYEVRYADGSSEVRSLTVPTVLPLPTLTSPAPNASTTATPTFSWTLPNGLPASVTQRLIIGSNGFSSTWQRVLPLSQTQATYNDDGKATEALQSGESYLWTVDLRDGLGDNYRSSGLFTVQ